MVDKVNIDGKLLGKNIAVRSNQKSNLDFVSGMWFDRENEK